MATRHHIELELWSQLTTALTETELSVRAFLDGYEPKAVGIVQGLLAAAPAASLIASEYNDDVNGGRGEWIAELSLFTTVQVADGVTFEEARLYLDGFYEPAQDAFRSLVGAAPVEAEATITHWHLHRPTGKIDQDEPR